MGRRWHSRSSIVETLVGTRTRTVPKSQCTGSKADHACKNQITARLLGLYRLQSPSKFGKDSFVKR